MKVVDAIRTVLEKEMKKLCGVACKHYPPIGCPDTHYRCVFLKRHGKWFECTVTLEANGDCTLTMRYLIKRDLDAGLSGVAKEEKTMFHAGDQTGMEEATAWVAEIINGGRS